MRAVAAAAIAARGPWASGQEIRVRPGYELTVAVDDHKAARFLEFDDAGRLYVSRPYVTRPGRRSADIGDITVFSTPDGRGLYAARSTFLEGPVQLHGLCWHGGWMWYSTSGGIHKARDTDGDGRADERVTVVAEGDLPSGGAHWWRSILVTDEWVYTSIGDSGNINDESGTERQKIWRMRHDGSDRTLFASGLRSTQKLRLRPGTSEVWGIDHGSDWFGRTLGEGEKGQPITDDNPPDELNRYDQAGFYGHPFIVGSRLPRYEYSTRGDIVELASRSTSPAWELPARWGATGFCFIDPARSVPGASGAMPADHAGDLFVAFHGSWNRREPAGYAVGRVLFDDWTGKPCGLLTIVEGLVDGQRLIRPVDCVQAPDGTVLFSCDQTGRVYRLRWTGLAAGDADEPASERPAAP